MPELRWMVLLGILAALWACDDLLVEPPKEPSTTEPRPADARPTEPSIAREAPTERRLPPSRHIPYRKTWYGGGVFYQIFPRSFFDSDGDGIGDLKGIAQKLDYLNTGTPATTDDLKISGIWLTPIFRSGSYHGYDTQDYMRLDPAYGSLDDLKQLLKQAHARGVKVILDLVLNHTSHKHPWFIDASKGPSADKRGWYIWRDKDPRWSHPFSPGVSPWRPLGSFFYYAVFSTAMPDLNLENARVKAELQKIARHWLEQGVDGFRLDAVRYFVAPDADGQADSDATHAYLKELSAFVQKVKPGALLAGEAWTTTAQVARYFGDGDQMDLCFQFDLIEGVDSAFRRGRASFVRTPLVQMLRHYRDLGFNAPILGNHDHKRLSSRLLHQKAAAKLAATLLLTLPGTPFVYYGEELGMGNSNNPGDISMRAPMQWDASAKAGFSTGIPWARLLGKQDQISVAAQTSKAGSMLAHYRSMIRLRARSDALKFGAMALLDVSGSGESSALAYLRFSDAQAILVVLNFSDAQTLEISLSQTQLKDLGYTPTTWNMLPQGKKASVSAKDGGFALPGIPPHQALIMEIR